MQRKCMAVCVMLPKLSRGGQEGPWPRHGEVMRRSRPVAARWGRASSGIPAPTRRGGGGRRCEEGLGS
eukprot:6573134-Heterocapsa_arctica.AAC.1